MKKKIILAICILLLILVIGLVAFLLCRNVDKTDYNRVYISSLNIEGRLAEYQFTPNISNNESYKIKLKVKDNLKENIRMSLYKIEDDKELNVKLDEKLETEELTADNSINYKLVIYIEKSYELLDKDYVDIGFLSIKNAN